MPAYHPQGAHEHGVSKHPEIACCEKQARYSTIIHPRQYGSPKTDSKRLTLEPVQRIYFLPGHNAALFVRSTQEHRRSTPGAPRHTPGVPGAPTNNQQPRSNTQNSTQEHPGALRTCPGVSRSIQEHLSPFKQNGFRIFKIAKK